MPVSQTAGSLWIGCEERCSYLWALQSQVTDRGKCWAWTAYHPSSVVFRLIHRLPSVPPTETSEELLACFPGQCACMGSHEEDSGCFICCFLQKQRKMFACSPKWSKEVLGETVSPLLCIDVRNVPANLVFGLHLRFTLPLVGSPTSKPASVMHIPLLCCCQPDHCHAMHGTADSRC